MPVARKASRNLKLWGAVSVRPETAKLARGSLAVVSTTNNVRFSVYLRPNHLTVEQRSLSGHKLMYKCIIYSFGELWRDIS
jgi:hypothetical protein